MQVGNMGISDTARQRHSYHPVMLLPGILFALLLAGRVAIACTRRPARPRFGCTGVLGPDDDPEFLRLLDHRIRGTSGSSGLSAELSRFVNPESG
jgi:hypothetical protein